MIGSENAPMPINGITPELRNQLLNALIQFPSIDAMEDIWHTHFEPCLLASDILNRTKNEAFTDDEKAYLLAVLQQLK